MKKHFKKILCLGMCFVMLMSTACGKKIDSESRHLMLAIGALDQNFNPFFSTTLNDSQVAGMTQASLLTSDHNGEVACGDDWPTVAQDYDTIIRDANGQPVQETDMEGTTEYQFLIKNGMRFSDGKPLTVKDVLFSLYVYLDPAYSGSATIYSTDILGLTAYRTQNPDAEDESGLDFYSTAVTRVQALIDWSYDEGELTTDMEKDLETVKKLFLEEATSDWTSVETSWSTTYKDSHNFNSAWEAYLYAEGIVKNQTYVADNGATLEYKGTDGKYLTTLNPNHAGSSEPGVVESQHHIDGIAEATTEDKINAYMSANSCSRDYALMQLQKAYAVETVYKNYTDKSNIWYILSGWATANNALEEFAADARSEYYEDNAGTVSSISGITHSKTSTWKGNALDKEHEVLSIKIKGVDPKAIWNFAFSVSPMHYYGGEYAVNNYNGDDNFGVKIGDKEFFSNVLKATDKNGLPVGAGAYMATSPDGSTVTKAKFFNNNMVYYERNPYFETMGKNINNAKIKYLTYKVMADDKIIDALITKEIDYGEPNATPSNKNTVSAQKHLDSSNYFTAGYGYVGINPSKVPDVRIRQAIMKSMDTSSIIKNYYDASLAQVIMRPMSTTSWAYPKTATEYESIKYDSTGDEIRALVESADYVLVNGKYYKYGVVSEDNKLKFTFTIAGESTDHPAYAMFLDSAEVLNGLGFEIDVKPDILALKKLNSGDLAIWAAAWSSGVDPDMYQVYHMDSKATSVNNWGYKDILNKQDEYSYEYDIVVNKLSPTIDAARQTLNRQTRINLYSECLDYIMDLAVELPTYQRKDLCAYNKDVIDVKTLNQNPTYNMGLMGRIWEVDYK